MSSDQMPLFPQGDRRITSGSLRPGSTPSAEGGSHWARACAGAANMKAQIGRELDRLELLLDQSDDLDRR